MGLRWKSHTEMMTTYGSNQQAAGGQDISAYTNERADLHNKGFCKPDKNNKRTPCTCTYTQIQTAGIGTQL